ncbi:MAG: flagellar basal body L-ring protein FlgH [Gemmatimonadales bacterium]|jgi:flagellar L-ring protein precursor FlgH|nr:flagellar basal body L-ring protein FlgH [Gemmatimonadales bacterium]MBP6571636.1 flagellar basal body L-ring protein FlgH [Gemmatimonadales bacterium]MBP7621121.1 flagellar basal body L-ring protein FlgH [Gemmatimonadales bacterium]
MNTHRALAMAMLVMAGPLAAQTPVTPANTDSVRPSAPPPGGRRLGWTSDRRPLRVGDLLTVIVDEQTSASERVITRAKTDRSQKGTIDANAAPVDLQSVGIGYKSESDQTGQRNRTGDLAAMLTVRVTGIEPSGVLRVDGGKLVTVDGRKQEVRLGGLVRPEDVTAGNAVLSSRIADASISYKGKNIDPKTGLFGKILGLLWP